MADLPDVRDDRSPLTVFQRKFILLSGDLNVSPRHRNILVDLITNGGGKIVSDVDSCDMFICRYRAGDQYIQAAQSGKDVGSLSWLYHLIINNEWTSPMRRLLHYPVPKDPIPGFEGLKITLSNYGGEARVYLENLITLSGATFTKTMKSDNTHLVTARNNSEKCDAAADWNVNMVNHLWIEESFAKCEVQQVTKPCYTHFPLRTNLGEVIGQTFLDEAKLREMYYPGGEIPSSPPAQKRKRGALEAAQSNAPAAGRQKPKGFDVLKDESEDLPAAAKAKKAVARSNIEDSFTTPARPRQVRGGKENETPSILSTGGRSAKTKALTNLHKIAPDVALYEKEKKRATKDGIWGGKRAADEIDRTKLKKSSPTRDVDEATSEEGDDEDTKRPAKRQRPSLPAVEMRIVLTGYERWVGNTKREDQDRV